MLRSFAVIDPSNTGWIRRQTLDAFLRLLLGEPPEKTALMGPRIDSFTDQTGEEVYYPAFIEWLCANSEEAATSAFCNMPGSKPPKAPSRGDLRPVAAAAHIAASQKPGAEVVVSSPKAAKSPVPPSKPREHAPRPSPAKAAKVPFWHEIASAAHTAAAEKPEAEAGLPSDNSWRMAEWLKGIQCTSIVADALMAPVSSSANKADLELPLLRAFKSHGSRDSVLRLLSEGGVLEQLADVIWKKASDLDGGAAACGSELHGKFVQDTQNFELAFGQLSAFFGGLEAHIGAPSARVFEAMEAEHCKRDDSNKEWRTGNYFVSTTPLIEWHYVVHTDRGPKEVGLEEWPRETKFLGTGGEEQGRKPRNLESYKVLFDGVNQQFKGMGEEKLSHAELVGVRLYTGPMFEKYNAVNRGGGLSKEQPDFMQSRFDELCLGNRYTTTIHVINSALIKLSKLQKAETVYRGIQGGILPSAFWKKNDVGVCGGIEFGFLSTTMDADVAMGYAQGGNGRAATVFEIKMGMVDRGADISIFSQYPHEKEICFAPLTGIEVLGTRVEGSVLIVQARLNVNLVAMTIEQVISKRWKMVVDMCQNLELETLQIYSGKTDNKMDKVLSAQGLLGEEQSLKEHVKSLFQDIVSREPEVFNDDGCLRGSIDSALAIKDFSFLDAKAMDRLRERGKEAAGCSALVAKRLSASEADVRKIALDTLLQIAHRGDQLVVEAVSDRLQDEQPDVRKRAAEVLEGLAERGDERAIKALTARLEDSDWPTREKSIDALQKIAERGDQRVTEALTIRLLEEKTGGVRRSATEALEKIAKRGDPSAVAALVGRLTDESWSIRSRAAEALGKIALAGDLAVIEALAARLEEDDHSKVRIFLVKALQALAVKGDPQSIGVVADRVKDIDTRVRYCAVEAIENMAEVGDQRAFSALVIWVQDQDAGVCKRAVEAVVKIAKKGDPRAIEVVATRLKDGMNIKKAVLTALASLAEKGDEKAIKAAASMLEDKSESIRIAALEALGKLAEQGDQQILAAVTASLKDQHWWVRKKAVEAMKQIAKTGDVQVIDAVARLLEDCNKTVRATAHEVLTMLRG